MYYGRFKILTHNLVSCVYNSFCPPQGQDSRHFPVVNDTQSSLEIMALLVITSSDLWILSPEL